MATAKQLLVEWMRYDRGNAADAILELAATLTVGQKAALRNRVRDDIKAHHTQERDRYDDTDADNLIL